MPLFFEFTSAALNHVFVMEEIDLVCVCIIQLFAKYSNSIGRPRFRSARRIKKRNKKKSPNTTCNPSDGGAKWRRPRRRPTTTSSPERDRAPPASSKASLLCSRRRTILALVLLLLRCPLRLRPRLHRRQIRPDAASEAQLDTIKAKLAGKSDSFRDSDRRSSRGSRRQDVRGRSPSSSRSRSPRRERLERWRRWSRSSSPPESARRKGRRSRSPTRRGQERPGRENREDRRSRSSREKEKGTGRSVDYSQLIEEYSNKTAAERVKAKMKLQSSQTAAKDKAMGKGWERFEFDKDAPLDDEEIEVADDDANLVKDMDRTFRFSSMEAKREADLKAAHDQAIFGVPLAILSSKGNEDAEGFREQDTADKSTPDANLMSEMARLVIS